MKANRQVLLTVIAGCVALAAWAGLPRVEPVKATAVGLDRLKTCAGIEAAGGMQPYYRMRPVASARAVAGVYKTIGGIDAVRGDVGVPGLPALKAGGRVVAAASTFKELAADGSALEALAGVSYWRMKEAGTTPLVAHVMKPLRAWKEAGRVFVTYRGMTEIDRVILNRFMTPEQLWRYGPLGVLGAEGNAAAERGDLERFDELGARFWDLYRAATERRATFGLRRGGGTNDER